MTLAMTFSPLFGQDVVDFSNGVVLGLFKLIGVLLATGLWVAIIAAEIYAIHFLFSLPMRRAERARLFLDLVDGAIQRGQSIEAMILSIARCRDQTVGVRFHLLAAYIEDGLHFSEALKKVPRFLPPQISAMLLVGERLGDFKKVLPACREILRDRPVSVRSAVHYLILVLLFFSPVYIGVVMVTMTFVVPKFKDVAAGMGVKLWSVSLFVFAAGNWLIAFEVMVSLLMIGIVLLYIGGPGLARRFQYRGFPIADWLAWRIPWKQKRLQRTFSAMLAVLLDGGVSEVEAVRLAGECTANEICRRRAARVVIAIEHGEKLTEAVRAFDDHREFHWRLTNAAHAHGGFLKALRGWHEVLDAKAFQQEEAAAQVVTSGVVIMNGLFVALIAVAMFAILMACLYGMAFAP
jgi:type II secretory pathway component PulF